MSAFDLRNAMFLDGTIVAIGGLRGNAPNPGGGGGGPSGPISKDGASHWNASNTSTVAGGSLTTTLTNDLIVAMYSGVRGSAAIATVSGVTSSSGLVFTRLGGITSPLQSGSKHINVEVWTAPAAAALTNEVITFTLTGAVTCNCAGAVALHGVIGTSGIYTLDGLVLTNVAANSGSPSVTMTTTYANDVIIYALGLNATSTVLPPTGFTQDAADHQFTGLQGEGISLSHNIEATTQTGLLLRGSPNTLGACVAFALKGS